MPPEVLVVRGGLLKDLDRIIREAQSDYAADKDSETRFTLPLSVAAGAGRDGETRKALLTRLSTEGELRNNKIRVVSLEQIEASGFHLVHDPPPPAHHVVDLGTENPMARLEAFEALLGQPEENPCPFDDRP
jgi:hypothetical protein